MKAWDIEKENGGRQSQADDDYVDVKQLSPSGVASQQPANHGPGHDAKDLSERIDSFDSVDLILLVVADFEA